jgi:hypothetical protein
MIDKPMSLLEQRRQELEQARAEYRYSVEKMHEAKQRVNDLRTEYAQFEADYNDRVVRRDNINTQLRETRREIVNLEKSLNVAKARLADLEAKAKRVVRPEAQRAGKALEEALERFRWGEQQLDNNKQAVYLATEKTKSAEIAYRLAGGKLSRQEMLAESNPWKSGSFYLVAFVVILAILGIIAANLPWYAVGTVIVGGVIALSIVGAFQLRQDAMLSEENFLKLMIETFKRLPLLTQKGSESDSSSKNQEGASPDGIEKKQ